MAIYVLVSPRTAVVPWLFFSGVASIFWALFNSISLAVLGSRLLEAVKTNMLDKKKAAFYKGKLATSILGTVGSFIVIAPLSSLLFVDQFIYIGWLAGVMLSTLAATSIAIGFVREDELNLCGKIEEKRPSMMVLDSGTSVQVTGSTTGTEKEDSSEQRIEEQDE